ncbi:hypothetical protein KFU94_13970 [Chloroflexi bacterium TSY]|nr:hypothetical protein [Chloroflexi bacterium TSY]
MTMDPLSVGTQRQLFIDDFWFASQSNVTLTLHRPELREVVMTCDRPWEMGVLHYSCVLLDEGRYRMWYRVDSEARTNRDERSWQCYAESSDGIHWEKPNLGITAFDGSRDNNILFPSEKVTGINPSIIKDDNAPARERYKMIIRSGTKPIVILGYTSEDGLHWQPIAENPLLTDGPFDSHNILIWDDERESYVIYMRGVDTSVPGSFLGGRRAIRRSESADFRTWTTPQQVVAADEDDPTNLHFYTNAAHKYDRAASVYLMFPMVLYPERHYPGAPNPGLSDMLFLSSRDGIHWDRRFRQPFISPGLDQRNWVDRNPIMGTGIVSTGPHELSMYYSDCYRDPASRFRRATIRPDGFVSVAGPYTGWGEFTSQPFIFTGHRLTLNYSTSGGGSIQVELQDESGTPIPGFTLAECDEIYGDKINGVVRWQGGEDVSALVGQPVCLRVQLRDAHLFAFQFSLPVDANLQ